MKKSIIIPFYKNKFYFLLNTIVLLVFSFIFFVSKLYDVAKILDLLASFNLLVYIYLHLKENKDINTEKIIKEIRKRK